MGWWKIFRGGTSKKFLDGKTIIPQYEPPEDLTAAELGLIVDQKGGRLEFLATIYQLKTRKVIALSRDNDGRITMTLLQYPKDALASYEDLLLRYFFHENKEVVLDDFFGRADFAVTQAYLQYMVMQTLQTKGLLLMEEGFASQPYPTYLDKVAKNPLKYLLGFLKHGVRKNLTAKAIEILPLLEGFKQYIETAELDKIKFHAAGNLEEYIERLTPYAIALNQMERWRLVGIPLFVFEPAQIKQAEYNPQADSPGNLFSETISMIKEIDAYSILAE